MATQNNKKKTPPIHTYHHHAYHHAYQLLQLQLQAKCCTNYTVWRRCISLSTTAMSLVQFLCSTDIVERANRLLLTSSMSSGVPCQLFTNPPRNPTKNKQTLCHEFCGSMSTSCDEKTLPFRISGAALSTIKSTSWTLSIFKISNLATFPEKIPLK